MLRSLVAPLPHNLCTCTAFLFTITPPQQNICWTRTTSLQASCPSSHLPMSPLALRVRLSALQSPCRLWFSTHTLTVFLFLSSLKACGAFDSASLCILEVDRTYDATLQLYSQDGHLIYWENVSYDETIALRHSRQRLAFRTP